MEEQNYISIRTFCELHDVKESFVRSMCEFEIVRVDQEKGESLLSVDELPLLEKMVRLHNELDINVEGVQAVFHLLQQVENLQDEVAMLRRKLSRFDF